MAILKSLVKGFLVTLVAFGLFAVVANAQPSKKKFTYKIDKKKVSFVTPTIDLPNGKLVVSGVAKGVEVSGGGGGCFNVTVTTYRLTPDGKKVAVLTKSKKLCLAERLPDIIIDRIPKGKYLVEIAIDRPEIGEGKLEGDLEIEVQPERIGLR